jgi:hypothetical protein
MWCVIGWVASCRFIHQHKDLPQASALPSDDSASARIQLCEIHRVFFWRGIGENLTTNTPRNNRIRQRSFVPIAVSRVAQSAHLQPCPLDLRRGFGHMDATVLEAPACIS